MGRASQKIESTERSAQHESVFSIMTREVTTVRREMTLASAMEALVLQDIGHLPVVDEHRAVVGILSKTDVVRQALLSRDAVENDEHQATPRSELEGANGFHEDREPTTVGDVMSPRAICVKDSVSIAEASKVMSEHAIHGLPVVNDENRLVGFLSTMDITRWVAQGPVR
jgi:CBS domain-containing protein